MIFILCLCLIVIVSALCTELEYQNEFTNFMKKYEKSYRHDEFQKRYGIFKSNLDFIDSHNAKKDKFWVKMNQFGDMTNDEFKKIYNGFKYVHDPEKIAQQKQQPIPDELKNVDFSSLPKTVDWRQKGAVTPVKNQGACGSCWSFSTTGSLEGQHFLSGQGSLIGLSEQNLMDCSTSYGNQGCGGGLMVDAYKYIIANKGIDTEQSYPYQGVNGNCHYKAANRGACMDSFYQIPHGNETAMEIAVATMGPISVGIDAGEISFQFYFGGVYYSYLCSSTALDHGVLVVGYGTYQGTKYWLVKNSWSASWGLNGYIMMIRGWHNDCGILSAASVPRKLPKHCH